MNNNFDLKKYLVENKLTYQEKMKGKAKKLNEVTDQAAAAEKASDKIADDPKIQQSVAQLSPDQINKIKQELKRLGINSNTSAVDIERKIEAQNVSENITEGDAKEKIAKVLQGIGAANIAAWGGVPAAIAIGTQTGMPLGFAISWGATTILMGLAKLLDKNVTNLDEASNKTIKNKLKDKLNESRIFFGKY